MFGKKKNKSNYYFDSFGELCHFSVQCCEYILNFENHFDSSKLEEIKTNVHLIEHAADDKKHEVTAKLMTEFMTPIDREDIMELLKEIDDITDAIEEVSLKLYLYDYHELPVDTIPFTQLTLECIQKNRGMPPPLRRLPRSRDHRAAHSGGGASRGTIRHRVHQRRP
jgi:predicted phosphate transport protein (TIGR00153 family)